MPDKFKHLYGPVPSRRLGLSLGVDIIPAKVCTLDCIYCQIGRTPQKTSRRNCYIRPEQILTELKQAIEAGLNADFITITGSGEPTLHSQLGLIIDSIRALTDIPIALITNGTLLSEPEVRADCAKADVVLPSLDAADEATFRKINRPCSGISIDSLISGLTAFRDQFSGRIWLEVFLIDGINTSDEQIAALAAAAARIRPDKIHLNTAVRPTAEPNVNPVAPEKLQTIAARFGPDCEVAAQFDPTQHHPQSPPTDTDNNLIRREQTIQTTLAMLQRRPCSIEDIVSGLGITPEQARQAVETLQSRGLAASTQKDGITFFHAGTPGTSSD